ncbi:MAG: hypothetical protein WC301_02110 [Candidatus Omnitrophota bacterium]|jgi:hypothetical protein
MKKLILLALFVCLLPVSSYAISNSDFAAAKSQLSSASATLTSSLLQISGMQQDEQEALQEIINELENGVLAIQRFLELSALHGAGVLSASSEAVGILTEASLDGIDLLTGIQEGLQAQLGMLVDGKVINIVEESIAAIEKAINALKTFQSRLSESEAKKSGG